MLTFTKRHAMQMKILPQRASRRAFFPLLAGLILAITLYTLTRLDPGSLTPLRPGEKFSAGGNGEKSGSGGGGKGEGIQGQSIIYRPELEPGLCPPEIEFLRRPELGLSNDIVYTRRCIKPAVQREGFDRDAIANVPDPLISSKTQVNLTSCEAERSDIPCEPLTLQVPAPYPKAQGQYSHLLFGVASTYERMQDSLPAFAHWMAGTGARLVGTVADALPGRDFNLTALEEEYARAGVQATFLPPKMTKRISNNADDDRPVPVEHHHFLLIRELIRIVNEDDDDSGSKDPSEDGIGMLTRRTPTTSKTKWLGILDDDTFFPSLYPLDEELKRHDHTKPQWLGALSENFEHVKLFGFMAFGGAGAFMSVPLARTLEPHAERCIRETLLNTGDGILRDCVYSHSRAKLTLVPDLYQHDFKGDPSGFYESGVRPLSLHHWKSWYKAPAPAMAAVAKAVCGDCFLQRWTFGEGKVVLSNGYSIAVYKNGVKGVAPDGKVDLGRVEGTWHNPERKYDFSYGPLRKKLEAPEKKSYRLVDVNENTGRRELRQVYVHKARDDGGGVDEVVELVWEIPS